MPAIVQKTKEHPEAVDQLQGVATAVCARMPMHEVRDTREGEHSDPDRSAAMGANHSHHTLLHPFTDFRPDGYDLLQFIMRQRVGPHCLCAPFIFWKIKSTGSGSLIASNRLACEMR